MKRALAFSLVELLVVVGMIAVLVGIIAPSLARAKFMTRCSACAANMNGIGRGLHLYATDNRGSFPTKGFGQSTTRYDVIGDDLTTMSPTGNAINSNSRNLFLLVTRGLVDTRIFVCPATNDQPAAVIDTVTGDKYYDFNVVDINTGYRNKCSYSYHLMFGDRASQTGYPITTTSDPSMVVLADKNPFIVYTGAPAAGTGCYMNTVLAVNSTSNSLNHDREGQNILFVDGHVQYVTEPLGGQSKDNFYTAVSGTVGVLNSLGTDYPDSDTDAFLVP